MQFSRSQRRWLIVLAALIIGGFFITRNLMAPAPVQYQTVKVANRDLQQNVLATGKLDAVRKVDVGAQVSGQLEKLYVQIGDQVEQGQLLAMIDPQQAQNQIKEVEATLQDLNAQLAQAKAEMQLAAVTLRRQQDLAKLQAVSRQDLDQASTTLAVKKRKLKPLTRKSIKLKPVSIRRTLIWITPRSLPRWLAMWCKSPPCKARR